MAHYIYKLSFYFLRLGSGNIYSLKLLYFFAFIVQRFYFLYSLNG